MEGLQPLPRLAADADSWTASVVRACGGQITPVPGWGVYIDLPDNDAFDRVIELSEDGEAVKGLRWHSGGLSVDRAERLLRAMPDLELLIIDRVVIEADAVAVVARLPRLRWLSMSCWRVGYGSREARLDDDAVGALSRSETIEYLDATGHDVNGETFAGLDSLKELYLSGISAKACIALSGLRRLEKLSVVAVDNSREAIAQRATIAKNKKSLGALGKLSNLRSLVLEGYFPGLRGSSEEAFLPIVKGCRQLESLSCPSSWLDPQSADELARLPKLKSLRLLRGPLPQGTVERIGRSHSLNILECDDVDEVCEQLRVAGPPRKPDGHRLFPALTHLTLDYTPIRLEHVRNVAKLVTLESVALSGEKVGENGLADLVGLSRLKKLSITNFRGRVHGPGSNSENGAGGPARERKLGLSGLETLTALSIAGSDLTSVSLEELSGLDKLKRIRFSGNTTLGPLTIESLESLKQIEHLAIDRSCTFPKDAFERIARMPALREFDLDNRPTKGLLSDSDSLRVVRGSCEPGVIGGILYADGREQRRDLGPGGNAF